MALPQTETGYDVPEEVASLQAAVDEFILLVTSQDASEEDFDLIKKTNSKEIKTTVTSENFGQNWSTNVPSEQVINQGRDAHEESRPEISGISEQVVSTSSDTVAKKSDSRNYIGSKCDVALERPSTGVNSEYLNVEKLYPHNENIEVIKCLDNKILLNTTKNIASNMNTFQKENTICKITDTEDFKATSLLLDDGVDDLYEDSPSSKLCAEKPKNGSPLKLETTEMKQKCNKFQNMNFLPPHYIAKFYCDACKVSYSEPGSHDSNQTCNVCKEIFGCKMMLADHYLTHEEFHETYCRICHSEIDKHKTLNGRRECCECEYKASSKTLLQSHLYTHSPLRLFKCEYCEMRFKRINNLRNHFKSFHPICELCGKRFVNNNSLYKHRLEEHS